MFLCNSWTEKRKRKRRMRTLEWSQDGPTNELSLSLPNLRDANGSNGAVHIDRLTLDGGPLSDRTILDTSAGASSPTSPPEDATAFLVYVHLKQGFALPAMDSTGSSDPYVKFKYKGNLVYKSEVVTQNLNPRWDEQFEQVVDTRSEPLKVEVYDFDRFTMDDFIGSADIDLSTLSLESPTDLKLRLANPDLVQEIGFVTLAISLKPLTKAQLMKRKDHTSNVLTWKTPGSHKKRSERASVIHVVLVEAKDLKPALLSRNAPKPDPYVKFRLGDERVKSRAASKTLDPKWMQAFVFHAHHKAESVLELHVFDRRRESLIGKCTVDLSTIPQEKSHHTWYELEGNAGRVLLAITISGLAQGNVSDLASFEANPLDLAVLKQQYSLRRTLMIQSVGFLIVKVFRAHGLASLDIGGKSDPFCVVELVNSRLQTNTIYKSLDPEWNKVFTFNVDDVNAALELTIYDEDPNKKMEFMGKVAVPLLNIRNNEKRWYALKDEHLLKRARGRILLEATLFWNPVKAAVRTFTPKEQKYTAQRTRFQRRVFMRNMDRVKKYGTRLAKFHQFMQNCFAWKSPPRSCAAFLVFILAVYFFEIYMIPLSFAIMLLLSYLTISVAQDDDECCSNEYIHSDSEGDEEDEEDKSPGATSFTARFDSVQLALLDIQTSLEFATSSIERIRNTFNFTQPFCSYLAILVIAIGAIVLYFIPVRWLIMAWGINKFTKKFRKPRGHVGNNELLDFLSRVPCDKELRMYGEYHPRATPQVHRDQPSEDHLSTGLSNHELPVFDTQP